MATNRGTWIAALILLRLMAEVRTVAAWTPAEIAAASYEELCERATPGSTPPVVRPPTPLAEPCLRTSIEQRDVIPIAAERPVGGLTYLTYDFGADMRRLDFHVVFDEFDRAQNVYVQFYNSSIGGAGIYFGIQNIVGIGRRLIFTRWFDETAIARRFGLLDAPACARFGEFPWEQRAAIYRRYFEQFPAKADAYRAFAAEHVRTNSDLAAFHQGDTYEGSFVGIRLSAFAPRMGFAYTFSLVQEETDDEGTWYRYEVQEDATSARYTVGALRFDRGARIHHVGGTWVEVFTQLHPRGPRADPCQHYTDLPRIRFAVTPTGDRRSPIRADVSYGTNDTLVHQQRIDFVRTDAHFDFAIGPSIVRTTRAGPIDLVPPYLAGSPGNAIRP